MREGVTVEIADDLEGFSLSAMSGTGSSAPCLGQVRSCSTGGSKSGGVASVARKVPRCASASRDEMAAWWEHCRS